MTYAEKFPVLDKDKSFALHIDNNGINTIVPCGNISCDNCEFKGDVDSELALTCKGARARWLFSACEESLLPTLTDEDKYAYNEKIYPPLKYSTPIKIEDDYGQEDEDILFKEKRLIEALMSIKHHCRTSECESCMLSNDGLECELVNNPVAPDEWGIDTVRRVVL